jgi:hypothetical protein
MAAERDLLFFDGGLNDPPALLRDFAASEGLDLVPIADPEEVLQRASRSFPACLVLDARHNGEACIELCKRIKEDPFTAITPVAVLVPPSGVDLPTPDRILNFASSVSVRASDLRFGS